MMKVALLISGYLRNYQENINFIKEEIINKFVNVDVYLHITNNENLEDKYLNQIDESDLNYLKHLLNPITTIVEDNMFYNENKKINNVINHWSKLYKLNEIKKINENLSGKEYDLVIRLRPDLLITSTNFFHFEKKCLFIPEDSKIDKPKLENPMDNYICDAFAFGDSKIMNEYFNIYKDVQNLIDLHGTCPETLLYEYLNLKKIQYQLFNLDYSFILSKCNVFAICGDSGSGKSTLSNLLKNSFTDSFLLECDRYHKWERTNNNWKTHTHLNPNANHITKMSEDIFNLKVGNEIYQVDYDHSTGQFTEQKPILPSNNLIVCGLHSLFNQSENNLYNLKIYMDTDDLLKKKWKISRDVKERGYTPDQVLSNIKNRESDFEQFILPQKDNADVIIKFFTIDEIDLRNLDVNPKLSLELLIDKSFNIKHILKKLSDNKIDFDLQDENRFNKITFLNYKKLIFFDINKNYTFYDYILYFILNLNYVC